jgi:hypothetical protein
MKTQILATVAAVLNLTLPALAHAEPEAKEKAIAVVLFEATGKFTTLDFGMAARLKEQLLKEKKFDDVLLVHAWDDQELIKINGYRASEQDVLDDKPKLVGGLRPDEKITAVFMQGESAVSPRIVDSILAQRSRAGDGLSIVAAKPIDPANFRHGKAKVRVLSELEAADAQRTVRGVYESLIRKFGSSDVADISVVHEPVSVAYRKRASRLSSVAIGTGVGIVTAVTYCVARCYAAAHGVELPEVTPSNLGHESLNGAANLVQGVGYAAQAFGQGVRVLIDSLQTTVWGSVGGTLAGMGTHALVSRGYQKHSPVNEGMQFIVGGIDGVEASVIPIQPQTHPGSAAKALSHARHGH